MMNTMHKMGIALATTTFVLAAAPAIASAAPTATFTINGVSALTVHVGDTLNYAWSSTNAVSASTTYMVDGTGPYDGGVNTLSGTYSEVASYKGDVTTFTYTVTDSSGKTASAHAVVKVLSGAVQNAAKTAADQEITRRITALASQNSKVQAMVYVSAGTKASLSSTIATETANLTALKAKIDADTDTATLKADIQSLTADYRIYLLVLPQGRVVVASDKIQAATAAMTTFAGKLQGKISAAQAAGKDTSALSASLSDMNAKVADATAQAIAAASEVATLVPDQGDASVKAANTAALQDARTKIQTATSDLRTAGTDAAAIVSGLKAIGGSTGPYVTLTYNGATTVTLNVGDRLNYAWSSTNAVSILDTYVQDSSSCGVSGTGPFTFPTPPFSGTASEVVINCWAGHTYTETLKVTDAQGRTASASATVKVNPFSAATTYPFYQLIYQGTWTSHMFTTDENEKNALTASYGFQYVGANAWLLSTANPPAGSVPLHRLYNPSTGAHLYTTSSDEVQSAETNDGFVGEGVHAYIYPTQVGSTVPLYRLRQSEHPDYYWTTDAAEYAQLPSQGYVQEGITGYAYANADPTACTWNGQSVANGATVVAYQSATVPVGQQCVSQNRVCSNGTLGGSYINPTCLVQNSGQNLYAPSGSFDSIDSSGAMTGWALDKDVSSQSINVVIYVDGAKGQGGQLVATVPTSVSRPDVNTALGVTGTHGFSWAIPSQYQNTSHTWYVYGVDSSDTNSITLLPGSPRTYPTAAPPADGYDIIIVAGQSNAVGTGLGAFTDPSASDPVDLKIVQIGRYGNDNMQIVPVGYLSGGVKYDGLQFWGYNGTDNAMGFALTFARKYVASVLQPNRKVLIVPAAYGGSSILQWLGDPSGPMPNNLYDDMASRVRAALSQPGTNRIVGFLWHQGEADIYMGQTTYQQKLTQLFQKVRADFPSSPPYQIIAGTFVPQWDAEDPVPRGQIENAIRAATAADPRASTASSDGLISNQQAGFTPNDDTMIIHFSAQSQITFGGRYFDLWQSLLAQQSQKSH